jgi:alpha-1,2-mannosyltransferase
VTKTGSVVWPSRWGWVGLGLLLAVLLGWGGLVELRAAFLQRRMTDAGCFFRAGWVVRSGGPLYDFTEENGWHYLYPPLFAILMVPLADAPAGADRTGLLPYPVSVGIWYLLSLAFLALALHHLARALEQTSTDPQVRNQPAGCRRWWLLRLAPLVALLPPVGHTLMRGQTNLLLLALLCGSAAAALRGRSWQAGLWLAGAICLKVYPAFLLLFFLWRRDIRALAGCGLGLLVGLILVPVAVFGPQRTLHYYQQQADTLLGPALGLGQDRSRGDEILDSINNDSQSLESALHNSLHLERSTRPAEASAPVKWTARGLALLLTILTLAAARGPLSAVRGLLFFSALIVIMLLACPVCHLHYLCLLIPLVMALLAADWEAQGEVRLRGGLLVLLALHFATYVLCNLPRLETLRDLAITIYPTGLLWLTATAWLKRRPQPVEGAPTILSYMVSVPAAPGERSVTSTERPLRHETLRLSELGRYADGYPVPPQRHDG